MAQYFAQEATLTYGELSTEAVNELFGKVYRWMAAGLALTAVTAYVVASSPALIGLFYGSGAAIAMVAIA